MEGFHRRSVLRIYMFLSIFMADLIPCIPWKGERQFPVRRKLLNPERPKFVLILLDGFAAAYLDKPDLVGFDYIKRNGVHATYMVPQFPTMTSPNLYSLLTGRYVDNHHITLNIMYDDATETTFDSSPQWWNKAETMWISTTLAGLRTRVYLWPGCEVPINGTRVEYCEKYSLQPWTNQLQHNLREVVQRFAEDTADVSFIYCEQPDFFGHLFGPDSTAVGITVRSIDKILKEFLDDIANKNLQEKVNFIVVSDHGMGSVGPMEAKKIALADYINLDDVKMILDRGAVSGIYPAVGKLDSVYQRLKQMPGMSVWKSGEIPEDYHFKLASTTPPITVLAHKGYYIKGVPDTKKQLPNDQSVGVEMSDLIFQGFHGYDANEVSDMRGIFLAKGPDFKMNFTLAPIFIKDVYNLAMHVIGVPALPNDGNWSAVEPALQTVATLRKPEGSPPYSAFTYFNEIILPLLLFFDIYFLFKYFIKK